MSYELPSETEGVGCILLLVGLLLHDLVLAVLEAPLVACERPSHLAIIHIVALRSWCLLNRTAEFLVVILVKIAAHHSARLFRGVAVVAVVGLYCHRHFVHLGAHLLEHVVVLTQCVGGREVIKLHENLKLSWNLNYKSKPI